MVYLEVIAGLLLLVGGGDALVRGAVAVARRLRVSSLLIGLTLVGFGTSTPELVTSLQAAVLDSPGIAVGNVVGSNIANILLILGGAALIHPLSISREALWRDGGMLLLATLTCLAVILHGRLLPATGLVLVVMLLAYIAYTYLRERGVHDASAVMHEAEAAAIAAQPAPTRLWLCLTMVTGGLLLTVLGARLLVNGTIELARDAGISETLLGLTVVAVGTSLPELVTSLVAALRRQADIALGNVLGSNIYNVLGILGLTALVQPVPVPPEIGRFDVWVMLGATLLLLLIVGGRGQIGRPAGGLLLAAYGGYLILLMRAT